jgi:hypothetical protein
MPAEQFLLSADGLSQGSIHFEAIHRRPSCRGKALHATTFPAKMFLPSLTARMIVFHRFA